MAATFSVAILVSLGAGKLSCMNTLEPIPLESTPLGTTMPEILSFGPLTGPLGFPSGYPRPKLSNLHSLVCLLCDSLWLWLLARAAMMILPAFCLLGHFLTARTHGRCYPCCVTTTWAMNE